VWFKPLSAHIARSVGLDVMLLTTIQPHRLDHEDVPARLRFVELADVGVRRVDRRADCGVEHF
jgi:hypothetical protein